MIGNYAVSAIRTAIRNKLTTLINITGLGVGVSVFSLIAIYIAHEVRVDARVPNSDRIYRVEIGDWSLMPPGFHRILTEVSPDIESVSLVGSYDMMNSTLRVNDRFFRAENIYSASPNVIGLLGIELLKGDAGSVLTNPFSVVLTESYARKLFGAENPINRVIRVNDKFEYTVTGIIRDFDDLHYQINGLFSIEDMPKWYSWPDFFTQLTSQFNYSCYIRINSNENLPRVYDQLSKFIYEKSMGEDTYILKLRPFRDIYFHGSSVKFEGAVKHGNLRFIRIMGLVAILILATACINYVNLNTAVAVKRAKEIGIRKVTGASRGKLIFQLLSESILITLVAVLLGIALTELMLPVFNNLIERSLGFNPYTNLGIIGLYMAGTLMLGILSGIYPAMLISRFRPVLIVASSFVRSRSSNLFRTALTVFQFTISVGLITSTLVIFAQLRYFRAKDTGFAKDQILYTPLPPEIARNYNAFKNTILKYPSVQHVTRSNQYPGAITWQESYKVNSGSVNFTYIPCDPDYVKTMGLTVVKGRDLGWEFPSDSGAGYLVNETLARMLPVDDPIGYTLPNSYGALRQIVGVVKDFNYNSLHNPIGPLALNYRGRSYNTLNLRISTNDIRKTLSDIESVWSSFVTSTPFEYKFLNESFNSQYRTEEKLGNLFGFFTLVAIAIGGMGLFGLATFALQIRVKEIGIRKVLGATNPQILSVLSKEYLLIVLTSNVIALPFVWTLMQQWLNTFAYRIGLSPGFFVISTIISLAIASLTILYNSLKAANTNPVDTLRYE